ncbi:hypothetical protein AVEN_35332-1, partial [Araneus ventricosus]
MPNNDQFTENLSSETDNDADEFEENAPCVSASKIFHTKETAPDLISFSDETLFSEEAVTPSVSDETRDNKNGNNLEFLFALLDGIDFSSETPNELPKEAVLEAASDEAATGSERLVSTEMFDPKEIEVPGEQILRNDDEKPFENENLILEADVNIPTAENTAADVKSSAFLDEQCHLQEVPILEKYDGTA